jgi:hypothetical protein
MSAEIRPASPHPEQRPTKVRAAEDFKFAYKFPSDWHDPALDEFRADKNTRRAELAVECFERYWPKDGAPRADTSLVDFPLFTAATVYEFEQYKYMDQRIKAFQTQMIITQAKNESDSPPPAVALIGNAGIGKPRQISD